MNAYLQEVANKHGLNEDQVRWLNELGLEEPGDWKYITFERLVGKGFTDVKAGKLCDEYKPAAPATPAASTPPVPAQTAQPAQFVMVDNNPRTQPMRQLVQRVADGDHDQEVLDAAEDRTGHRRVWVCLPGSKTLDVSAIMQIIKDSADGTVIDSWGETYEPVMSLQEILGEKYFANPLTGAKLVGNSPWLRVSRERRQLVLWAVEAKRLTGMLDEAVILGELTQSDLRNTFRWAPLVTPFEQARDNMSPEYTRALGREFFNGKATSLTKADPDVVYYSLRPNGYLTEVTAVQEFLDKHFEQNEIVHAAEAVLGDTRYETVSKGTKVQQLFGLLQWAGRHQVVPELLEAFTNINPATMEKLVLK